MNPIRGVRRDDIDRMAFWVDSDQLGHKAYRVDLEDYDGMGACDCPDFNVSRKKDGALQSSKRRRLEEGQRSPGCLCKHLLRAHLFNSIDLTRQITAVADAGKKVETPF